MRKNLGRTVALVCVALFANTMAAGQPCTQPPAPPANVQVPPDQDCGVTIFFDAPGATKVRAYRTTTAAFVNPVQTNRSSASVFFITDYAAPHFTQLYYWLAAENDCGLSAPVGPYPVIVVDGPPALANFRLASQTCAGVGFTWDSPQGGQPYYLEAALWRSASPLLSDAQRIATFMYPVNSPRYTDTAGAVGAPYWYWIQQVEDICPGQFSGPLNVTRDGTLPAPAIFFAQPALCNRIRIYEIFAGCATSFTIYRNRAPGDNTLISIAAAVALPYDDYDVFPGQQYFYRAIGHWIGPDSPLGPAAYAASAINPPLVGTNGDGAVRLGETLYLGVPIYGNPIEHYTFQWRKDGRPLQDGDRVHGSGERDMTVSEFDSSDAGLYDVIVSYACGTAISPPSLIQVDTSNCPRFMADYNQDGGIDGSDVEAFFMDWENGQPCADTNQDGGVDGQDVATFFICWEWC